MPIRRYKPTSPGRRFMSVSTFEELFGVNVIAVNVIKVQSKPKRRGLVRGRKPGWKKAIVQLRQGESIEIFEGAQA